MIVTYEIAGCRRKRHQSMQPRIVALIHQQSLSWVRQLVDSTWSHPTHKSVSIPIVVVPAELGMDKIKNMWLIGNGIAPREDHQWHWSPDLELLLSSPTPLVGRQNHSTTCWSPQRMIWSEFGSSHLQPTWATCSCNPVPNGFWRYYQLHQQFLLELRYHESTTWKWCSVQHLASWVPHRDWQEEAGH